MDKTEANVVKIFSKNAREAIGVGLSEWKGQVRVDVRIYVPSLEDTDTLIPTKKGLSLPVEKFPELMKAIYKLGETMSNEKVVARIKKSGKEEIRVGTSMYRDIPLIYIRTFAPIGEKKEWKPTQRGISLKVDLYENLLSAFEELDQEIEKQGLL